jgi:hypothetical protein
MLKLVEPNPKAKVWWNGEQWESYVPGDQYSFVDPTWQNAMHWADLGMLLKRPGR